VLNSSALLRWFGWAAFTGMTTVAQIRGSVFGMPVYMYTRDSWGDSIDAGGQYGEECPGGKDFHVDGSGEGVPKCFSLWSDDHIR
jgi:hypothetical protein